MPSKMKNCPFCNINQNEIILFSTKYFFFMSAKTNVTPHHHLLISRKHVRSELDFTQEMWRDYQSASSLAWNLLIKLSKQEPLIFINPPHMQSVAHFHKHYLDGIFGIHGVANALQKSLHHNVLT